MNRKKLGLLLGAGAIAVCNALIAHSFLAGHATPSAQALQQDRQGSRVLVARRDLPVGAVVTPDAVGFVEWPRGLTGPSNLTSSAYFFDARSASKLVGTVVRTDIAAGQPIARGALVTPGDRGFLAAALSPGLRAITIPVTERSGVGGFVFPGDRVDLMLTQTVHGNDLGATDQNLAVTETILRDLRVLATDQSMGTDASEGRTLVRPAHTVTLEVSPRNAEKIEVAQSVGALSLALRALTNAPTTGANPDRAIASGSVSIPPNASLQDEERLIDQASSNRSEEDGPGYVTGGDVSRFLRRAGARMATGADDLQTPTRPPLARAGHAAPTPGIFTQTFRGGGVVTVSRGKEITPVAVGGL